MIEELIELDWIDRYVRGELTGADLQAFEEKVRTDAVFKNRVNAQRKLVGQLQDYGTRDLLKKQLNQYHAEMSPKEVHRVNEKPVKYLWPMLGVAATVGLIALFVSFYSWKEVRNTEDEERSHYKELRRDLEIIKKSGQKKANSTTTPVGSSNNTMTAQGGSGFVVSPKGVLLTSAHVVNGADSIIIENENASYHAVVFFTDSKLDIAAIKITDPDFKGFSNIPYVLKKGNAEIGNNIFTLGFPRNEVVYGEGYISSSSGFDADTMAYQITVPLNPGNSGGPVFDENGNVVGIISGKHATSEGAGFAIKTSQIFNLIDTISIPGSNSKISLNRYGLLKGWKRQDQLKKIKPHVFDVKVYR